MIFNKYKRIFLSGHRGMVGGASMLRLAVKGKLELFIISHEELDLRSQDARKPFCFYHKKTNLDLLSTLVHAMIF